MLFHLSLQTKTANHLCDYTEQYQLNVEILTSCLKEFVLRHTANVQFLFYGQFCPQVDRFPVNLPLGLLFTIKFLGNNERKLLTSKVADL